MEETSISGQAVGAYGEKAVEAELLRHGWITANINTSIKNAADFDIFARKGARAINVRVKTSGPRTNGFQFGGFRPGQGIVTEGLDEASDFTVLVNMGHTRNEDEFYVIPTRILREQIKAWRDYCLAREKPPKDIGHWTLYLADLRSGEDQPNHGFAKKWARYSNNWASLDSAQKLHSEER